MKATIEILGKKYTGEGKTVSEALLNLPYKGFPKLKAMLTVIKDDKTEKTIVLMPLQTQRLFAPSPLMREIAIKNTAIRF